MKMKNKLYIVLGFAVGVGAGILGTRKYFSAKYEQQYQEERASMKENMAVNYHPIPTAEEANEAAAQARTKPDIKQYAASLAEKEGYLIPDTDEGNEIPVDPGEQGIHIIAPEEFGEKEGYETLELTYYSDGVLENEDEKRVDDIESLIGPDALSSFGEYEDDSVYVRNDALKLDIQILYDEREYADLVPHRPPEPEG